MGAVPLLLWQQARAEYARLEPLNLPGATRLRLPPDDARNLHLTTLSQAAANAPKWRVGVGYEFLERPDGFNGLVAVYDLQFKDAPRVMDLGLLYRALQEKQVDIVAGNSTDGLIAALGYVVLNDDKNYFPPYEAVPLVRQDALARFPDGVWSVFSNAPQRRAAIPWAGCVARSRWN